MKKFLKIISLIMILSIIISMVPVMNVLAANPYLPLWEHLPDNEPRVFEDPDNPGQYRAYIIGSHDTRRNSYCGPDIRMWSASVDDLTDWRDDGAIFTYRPNDTGNFDVMYAPDMVEVRRFSPEVVARGRTPQDERTIVEYYLYPHSTSDNGMVCKSDRPDGPFVPVNVGANGRSLSGSIVGFDPSVWVDYIDDPADPNYNIGFRAYVYYGFQRSYADELDQDTMWSRRPGTARIDYFMPSSSSYGVIRDPAGTVYPCLAPGENPGDFNFFEAASMRKVGNKYIMVFSGYSGPDYGLGSTNSALRWAYGDSPLGPFKSGGVLVDSRGPVLNQNGTGMTTGSWGHNTHGSLWEINGQWYTTYHRPPRGNGNARQAVVAPIKIEWTEPSVLEGGTVTITGYDPYAEDEIWTAKTSTGVEYRGAEVTSEGFQIYGLPPYRYYSAGLVCVAQGTGTIQDAYDIWDNHMPIESVQNGYRAGYKYFGFGGLDADKKGLKAFEGTAMGNNTKFNLWLTPRTTEAFTVQVWLDGPWANDVWNGKQIGTITVPADSEQVTTQFSVDVSSYVDNVDGKHAIYLVVNGGSGALCDLIGLGFSADNHEIERHVSPSVSISVGGTAQTIPALPIASTNANGIYDYFRYQVSTSRPSGDTTITASASDPSVKVMITQAPTSGAGLVRFIYNGVTKLYRLFQNFTNVATPEADEADVAAILEAEGIIESGITAYGHTSETPLAIATSAIADLVEPLGVNGSGIAQNEDGSYRVTLTSGNTSMGIPSLAVDVVFATKANLLTAIEAAQALLTAKQTPAYPSPKTIANTALQNAVTFAQGVYGDGAANDDAIINAFETLSDAVKVFQDFYAVDQKLSDALAEANQALAAKQPGTYPRPNTSSNAALQGVITAAQGVFGNADATEAMISGAIADLAEAVKVFLNVYAQDQVLANALTTAERELAAKQAPGYARPNSANNAAFANAIAGARAVYNDPDASGSAIVDAVTNLNEALRVFLSFYQLDQKLGNALMEADQALAAKQPDAYARPKTPANTAFASAIASARTVYSNLDATETAINGALTALKEASDVFQGIYDLDSKLADLLAMAQRFLDGKDPAVFPNADLEVNAALSLVITACQSVSIKDTATETDLLAALDDLNAQLALFRKAYDLVLWYKFDETSGTVVHDSSGNNYHATMMNGASFTGTAASLAGSTSTGSNGQHIELPRNILENVPDDFTVSAWVMNRAAGQQQWIRVFDFGPGDSSNIMFLTARDFQFSMDNNTNGAAVTAPAASRPTNNINQWLFVTVTHEGDMTRLYVNGTQVASGTQAVTANRTPATGNFYIGRANWADQYPNMQISDFRIYSRAISAEEVVGLYEGDNTKVSAAASEKDGALSVVANVYSGSSAANATVLAAAYNGLTDQLIGVAEVPLALSVRTSESVTLPSLDISNVDDYYVKVFLWDASTKAPLVASQTIPVEKLDPEPDPQPAGELIVNGSFEDADMSMWTVNDTANIARVANPSGTGFVVYATGRTTTGSGPAQNVTAMSAAPVKGATYQVSCKIYYDEATAPGSPNNKQFYFNIKGSGSYSSEYNPIRNMQGVRATKGQWSTITGTYTVESDLQEPYLNVFVETSWAASPSATNDLFNFYVDDISMVLLE